MSTQRVSFNEYLKSKYIKKGEEYTHTRIGDKESEIAGGTYNIKDEDEFLEKYYDHVFVKGNKEYLNKKQRI